MRLVFLHHYLKLQCKSHFVTTVMFHVYVEYHCSRWWHGSNYFLLGHDIEHYHCQKLWFTYCNPCNLLFSSLEHENRLKKRVRNVAKIKYGFVESVVILFTYIARCDYVILSDYSNYCPISLLLNIEEILEKLLYRWLYTFLSNIISITYILGFRQH